jgi:hypothetical protein
MAGRAWLLRADFEGPGHQETRAPRSRILYPAPQFIGTIRAGGIFHTRCGSRHRYPSAPTGRQTTPTGGGNDRIQICFGCGVLRDRDRGERVCCKRRHRHRPETITSGTAGAGTAACLAHVVGGLSEDWYEYYTAGCTGHDEPELDPVSSAPGSAQNITWRVALPADGTSTVSSVGPTFWFGGTVKDTNPKKIGGEGFLELQFYPDSFTTKCSANGGFSVQQQPDV